MEAGVAPRQRRLGSTCMALPMRSVAVCGHPLSSQTVRPAPVDPRLLCKQGIVDQAPTEPGQQPPKCRTWLRVAGHPAGSEPGMRLWWPVEQGKAELAVGLSGGDSGEDRRNVVATDNEPGGRRAQGPSGPWRGEGGRERSPTRTPCGRRPTAPLLARPLPQRRPYRLLSGQAESRCPFGAGEAGPQVIERGDHGVGQDHGVVSGL